MIKLDCVLKPPHPLHRRDLNQWIKSAPFFINHRGVLTHRVKSVTTYLNDNGTPRHNAVDYWCGNGTTSRGEFTDLRTIDTRSIVICEHCERAAVVKGLQATYLLVGRHVHVGRAKAIRTCCKESGDEA